MGNRSKYLALTAAAAGVAAAARRRARLRSAAEGIGTTIMPTRGHAWPTDAEFVGDGQAPGHRHLERVADERLARSWRRLRPWATGGGTKDRPYLHD